MPFSLRTIGIVLGAVHHHSSHSSSNSLHTPCRPRPDYYPTRSIDISFVFWGPCLELKPTAAPMPKNHCHHKIRCHFQTTLQKISQRHQSIVVPDSFCESSVLAQSMLTHILDILPCSLETSPATVKFDTSEGLKSGRPMTKDWHAPEQIVSELRKMRHAEVRLSAGPSLPVAVCSVVDPASHHPSKRCAWKSAQTFMGT